MRNRFQLTSQYHVNFMWILLDDEMYIKINNLKGVLIKLF